MVQGLGLTGKEVRRGKRERDKRERHKREKDKREKDKREGQKTRRQKTKRQKRKTQKRKTQKRQRQTDMTGPKKILKIGWSKIPPHHFSPLHFSFSFCLTTLFSP